MERHLGDLGLCPCDVFNFAKNGPRAILVASHLIGSVLSACLQILQSFQVLQGCLVYMLHSRVQLALSYRVMNARMALIFYAKRRC